MAFRFRNHDSLSVCLDIPTSVWISNQRVRNEFNLGWISCVEDAIPPQDFFSRIVFQRHLSRLNLNSRIVGDEEVDNLLTSK